MHPIRRIVNLAMRRRKTLKQNIDRNGIVGLLLGLDPLTSVRLAYSFDSKPDAIRVRFVSPQEALCSVNVDFYNYLGEKKIAEHEVYSGNKGLQHYVDLTRKDDISGIFDGEQKTIKGEIRCQATLCFFIPTRTAKVKNQEALAS